MQPEQFSQVLLDWYDGQGRKQLPWRQQINPYRVWVSEIMLQQTQVKTVIPYYERFMQAFPNLQDLAKANLDTVLHLWTGLGYYARARNLHRAAQEIQQRYQGQFPDSLAAWQALPGIGRSTAGAILAIAMQHSTSILDGNVKRVLARYHALTGPVTTAAVIQELWRLAELYTPVKRAGDYAQAIMDLGAMLCTRSQPQCAICPIAAGCKAYQQQTPTAFPERKQSKSQPKREIRMLIFYNQPQRTVLLEKRPPVGIWGGLWSFPECEVNVDLPAWCLTHLHCQVNDWQEMAAIKHVFSHFQLKIIPLVITNYQWLARVMDSSQQVWYNLNSSLGKGVATPVKCLLEQLNKD